MMTEDNPNLKASICGRGAKERHMKLQNGSSFTLTHLMETKGAYPYDVLVIRRTSLIRPQASVGCDDSLEV